MKNKNKFKACKANPISIILINVPVKVQLAVQVLINHQIVIATLNIHTKTVLVPKKIKILKQVRMKIRRKRERNQINIKAKNRLKNIQAKMKKS